MEMQSAGRGEAPGMPEREGRRLYRRLQYQANASVCRASAPVPHKATVVDLSREGCLLRLVIPADFEVDDQVELSVQSPDLSFRANGSVRQVRDGGMLLGVHLQQLTSRGSAYLTQLVGELEANSSPAV